MNSDIEQISVTNILGSVNCYLVKAEDGFFLIDTGWTNRRSYLENRLEKAGCNSSNLKLIILTHGDFDHSGNCLYLSKKFNASIAMHHLDSGMVGNGDMFWNRKRPNALMKSLAQVMFKLNPADRFKPQVFLENNQSLGVYGFNATVLNIPGHSKGSIGILTANGDLFCGDLFENRRKPSFSSIMDDLPIAKQSLDNLKVKNIGMVYPGHGKPFLMEALLSAHI